MSIIVAVLALAVLVAGLGFAVHILWLMALLLLVIVVKVRFSYSRERLAGAVRQLAAVVGRGSRIIDELAIDGAEERSTRVSLADLLESPKARDEEYIEQ